MTGGRCTPPRKRYVISTRKRKRGLTNPAQNQHRFLTSNRQHLVSLQSHLHSTDLGYHMRIHDDSRPPDEQRLASAININVLRRWKSGRMEQIQMVDRYPSGGMELRLRQNERRPVSASHPRMFPVSPARSPERTLQINYMRVMRCISPGETAFARVAAADPPFPGSWPSHRAANATLAPPAIGDPDLSS